MVGISTGKLLAAEDFIKAIAKVENGTDDVDLWFRDLKEQPVRSELHQEARINLIPWYSDARDMLKFIGRFILENSFDEEIDARTVNAKIKIALMKAGFERQDT